MTRQVFNSSSLLAIVCSLLTLWAAFDSQIIPASAGNLLLRIAKPFTV
jgi:hypothetical protein